jgi:hypothetical protein
MTSAYNDTVIYYPAKWARQQLEQDLDAVYDMDENDGVYLDALFDLLEENQAVRQALAEGQFRRISDPRFDAAPLEWAKKRGYNLYYLKMWRADGALLPVRLIYAVNHMQPLQAVWVLGLMQRSDDYDEHSEFAERIRHDYDRFGIPCWPKQ